MRITLTLDDELATALEKRASQVGKSCQEIVSEILRAALATKGLLPRPKPYSVAPISLGDPLPGIGLDKAVALAGELEDTELARKARRRK